MTQLLPPADSSPPDEMGDPNPAAEVEPATKDDDDSGETSEHVDFRDILPRLPNLRHLSASYTVKECGMNFKWSMFGMTKRDATYFANAVRLFAKLQVLELQSRWVHFGGFVFSQ